MKHEAEITDKTFNALRPLLFRIRKAHQGEGVESCEDRSLAQGVAGICRLAGWEDSEIEESPNGAINVFLEICGIKATCASYSEDETRYCEY